MVRQVLNVCLLLTLLLGCVSARSRSSETRSRSGEDRGPKEANVCDLPPDERAYCYCDNNDLRAAKEASCWVFSDCKPDDPIWDVFSTQPEIKRFKLLVRPDSSLDFLPTRALRYLKRIKSLDIQYASIPVIPSFAFANSTTLEDISLTRNHIEKLQPDAFNLLPALKRITLDENRISVLLRGTFNGAPFVTQLYLAQNNISFIEDSALEPLRRLLELVLTRNNIVQISSRAFKGLNILERLDLSENQITELPDMAFAEMPELHELDLDRNRLQVVGEMVFTGLPHLERLSLGGNQLTAFSAHALQGVPGLRVLDLRDNELRTLTRRTIEPMIDNLRNATAYLLLTGNLFECDCRMSWVHSLHNETASESVRNALEELTCTLSGGSLPGGNTLQDAAPPASVNNRVSGGNRGKNPHVLEYEDEEEMDDDAFYRPPYPPPAASMEPPTKHLLEIAPELLPCPSEHTAPPPEPIDLTYTFGNSAINHIPGWLCLSTYIIIAMLW